MGFMDKIKGMVNPDNVDENYDDEYIFDGNDEGGDYGYDDGAYSQQGQQQNRQTQQQSGVSLNSNTLELRVVRPEKYDTATAQKIADHLLNRRTVVLNLELANKESQRRLIDFLTGVAYSIEGYIQRVANNTFVIVPNNVDVSGEQITEQAQQPQQQSTVRDTGDIY
ncbi:MAG: cell division protein SepF [Firmicutes bacterium]|nr:cell division protein SepF [Bacillota bacterium]